MPARKSALGSDCARAMRGCSRQSHGCLERLAAGQEESLSLSACVCRLSVLFQRFFTALSVLRARAGSASARCPGGDAGDGDVRAAAAAAHRPGSSLAIRAQRLPYSWWACAARGAVSASAPGEGPPR